MNYGYITLQSQHTHYRAALTDIPNGNVYIVSPEYPGKKLFPQANLPFPRHQVTHTKWKHNPLHYIWERDDNAIDLTVVSERPAQKIIEPLIIIPKTTGYYQLHGYDAVNNSYDTIFHATNIDDLREIAATLARIQYHNLVYVSSQGHAYDKFVISSQTQPRLAIVELSDTPTTFYGR